MSGVKRALAGSLLALVAIGCGLPDEVREPAEALPGRIDSVAEEVDSKSEQLDDFIGADDNSFLRPYMEREDWPASFDEARQELGHARELFATEIEPRLTRDDPDEAEALRDQTGRAGKSIDRAVELAREPARRAAFVGEARERAPELVREGEQSLGKARGALSALAAEVAKAQRDYPDKRDDLAGRLAAVEQLTRDAADNQVVAAGEQAKGEAADWARLGDAAGEVARATAAVATSDAALRTMAGELYRSYSKTLLDMKEVATVEIGRTSWNEAYDFPRESELRFRVEVSPEDLETLEAWGAPPIAKLGSSWGRSQLSISIDRALWDSLGIDPLERMPRGDTHAEYWVGESSSAYFHRYAVVEGGESTQTDWVSVDEDTYEDHFDDLGMDIVAKPYGVYEEEALHEASPPGMAYVGNPKYGRWENDSQGRRHWSWGQSFLFYYLIFGGPGRHHYYYNDWNRWNTGYRGRAAWYGPDGNRAVYGTYGSRTRNSARYGSSGFARGGGFSRADRSVRGAGPRGRGGGPGGGGK